MLYYNFAGIILGLKADYQSEFTRLKPFLTDTGKEPDMRVSLYGCDVLEKPMGRKVLCDYIKQDIRMELVDRYEHGISFYLERYSTKTVLSRLDTDRAWSSPSIAYLKNEEYYEHYSLGLLGGLLIKNKIMMCDGLVVHASAIMHNGSGIIFPAPSGTGKSTHAKLWEDHMGAVVLNDDSPALRIVEGEAYIYGIPWSGSSSKFDNSSARLKAIVMLQQARENKIERLNPGSAIKMLFPRCYIPAYDRKLTEAAIATFDRIIGATPVYLLGCTPEKEAMELVYKCVN